MNIREKYFEEWTGINWLTRAWRAFLTATVNIRIPSRVINVIQLFLGPQSDDFSKEYFVRETFPDHEYGSW
jgi:hypothetical protein